LRTTAKHGPAATTAQLHFDPAGQFLYCCNQRGDNITVFRIDPKSGGLTFTGHYTSVGNPSMIVFLDLAKSN